MLLNFFFKIFFLTKPKDFTEFSKKEYTILIPLSGSHAHLTDLRRNFAIFYKKSSSSLFSVRVYYSFE